MKASFWMLALLSSSFVARTSLAGGGHAESVECPRCHTHCEFSLEQVDVAKHFYKVECETICIPRVRYPWEKCGPPKCARERVVRRLKKVEYHCKECQYTWTPVRQPSCETGACPHHAGAAQEKATSKRSQAAACPPPRNVAGRGYPQHAERSPATL